MLTLYFAPGACSMAAHIVLEESGEPYQARRMDLAKGEQLSATSLGEGLKGQDYRAPRSRGIVFLSRVSNASPLMQHRVAEI